jgi:hypothetical protein
VTRRQLTLAVPAVLTLHNLEEALTFQSWLPVIQTRVPSGFQVLVDEILLTAIVLNLPFSMYLFTGQHERDGIRDAVRSHIFPPHSLRTDVWSLP